jgi:hypothetical protein
MMDKELFESVYRESNYYQSEVDSEDLLKALLDAGVKVEAKGTGPFGEDTGATVIGFGKIKDLRDELTGVEYAMNEEGGYDDIEDWFADNENTEVIVLDQPIGQSGCNWMDTNGFSAEDLDLWADKDEVEKVSAQLKSNNDSRGSVIGTWGSNPLPNGYNGPCPNCGGKVFGYAKLPMTIMHGADYNICRKCGAMYPYEPWREGENHD